MSAARTARRRRKQHANGFAHLAPRQRPRYSRGAGNTGPARINPPKK